MKWPAELQYIQYQHCFSLGHNCVWHQQLPSWVVNGTFTESEILAAVERHCGTLVGRYRGQM